MIKTIIIDDEKSGAEVLQLLLQQNCPTIQIIAIENSAEKGIKAIMDLKPNLVFLDIEMPTATGFDIIDATKDMTYEIVFTTAYEHYAIKALKVRASDYLLKPIDLEELLQCVSNIEARISKSIFPSYMQENLLKVINNQKKILFPTSEGVHILSSDEIMYLESESNYTKVYLKDGRKIVISKTLKNLEEQLKECHFLRVHSTYLVNLNEIEKYIKGDGGQLILKNKTSIPVSRTHKLELLDILGI